MENGNNIHFILIDIGVQIENKSELYQKTCIFGLSEPNNKANVFSLSLYVLDVT